MIRGLYSAASGMFSLERKQEALSHNLANAQTPGYKKDDAVQQAFPNLLIHRIRDFQEQVPSAISGAPQMPGLPVRLGELSNGVYTQERIPSFQQGPLVQTNNPLDLAIEDGQLAPQIINGREVKPVGLFAVQLPNGTIGYTRNGKWDVDASGFLVTSEGHRVIGSNGQPVQLGEGVTKQDLYISGNGQLIVYPDDPARMNVAGEIGIAVANNPFELRRLGGSVYQADNPLPLNGDGLPAGLTLHQGFIEQSNVDLGQTMADMMMTVRAYEANQKVITAYNQSLDQLYTVGRMNG